MHLPELRAEAALPLRGRSARIRIYQACSDDELVVALVQREDEAEDWPLVRIHSQCLTGDTLGSVRCDCGSQLHASLDAISRDPYGILIYLPSHEGRGIGLVNKIRAYALQDEGLDTVEANVALRFPVDARRYELAVAVLGDLGVSKLRLLTNNPDKLRAVRAQMDAVRVPMPLFVTEENQRYLTTKRIALGHLLPDALVPANGLPRLGTRRQSLSGRTAPAGAEARG